MLWWAVEQAKHKFQPCLSDSCMRMSTTNVCREAHEDSKVISPLYVKSLQVFFCTCAYACDVHAHTPTTAHGDGVQGRVSFLEDRTRFLEGRTVSLEDEVRVCARKLEFHPLVCLRVRVPV